MSSDIVRWLREQSDYRWTDADVDRVEQALADAEARAVQPWREALQELLRSTEEFVRMSDQTTQEVEDAIYKARALLAAQEAE